MKSAPNLPKTSVMGRNLLLLEALASEFRLNLDTLCERTELSKPTAHRILAGLVAAGIVAKDGRFGEYRLTSALARLGQNIDDRNLILDSLKDGAREMTLRRSWPVAVGFLREDKVVVTFSTRKFTTLKLKPSTLYVELELDSAMGQATMASLSDARCEALLDGSTAFRRNSPARKLLMDKLALTRRRGYGVRLVGREGTSSVAVSLNFGGPAVGAVVATVFEKVVTDALIVSLAKDLQSLRDQALTRYRDFRPNLGPIG